jgi:hypothetical protein
MKFKTTKKEIENGYNKVIAIGYCNAQYLLHYENPVAYTHGVSGWGADIYDINGIAVVTGYNPFGKRIPFSAIQSYEIKAQEIVLSNEEYETKKAKVFGLLQAMLLNVM